MPDWHLVLSIALGVAIGGLPLVGTYAYIQYRLNSTLSLVRGERDSARQQIARAEGRAREAEGRAGQLNEQFSQVGRRGYQEGRSSLGALLEESMQLMHSIEQKGGAPLLSGEMNQLKKLREDLVVALTEIRRGSQQ